MEKTIYIQLLDEGTLCFRPVQAREITTDTYEVLGYDIHNPEDEIWEFLPGTIVQVEERNFHNGRALLAVKEISTKSDNDK